MDFAKALIDHGFHPPTIYFPLIVNGALMIEPTETESKETLDSFIEAMQSIAKKGKEDAESFHSSPHLAKVTRPDEAQAARIPNSAGLAILLWGMCDISSLTFMP